MKTDAVNEPTILASSVLLERVRAAVEQAGGWLPFDRFMAMALYEPGLGYYANGCLKFGQFPASERRIGSDFVTAPELTPLFGRTLAHQLAQAMQATGTDQIWEFGAGSGALAAQVLGELAVLGQTPARYTVVELSGELRERQRSALAEHADQVHWAHALPPSMQGVLLGNEVLDAMPVQLLARAQGRWFERGVAFDAQHTLQWADRPTTLRPPCEVDGAHDYVCEIHPQAEAFIKTVAERLRKGAAFFIDYGFPEAEYHHPQRHMGTLMCHRAHLSDSNPLVDVGDKDITAHVNFTAIALAAQDMGMEVLGYTSQARFLFNCGLLRLAASAGPRENAMMQKLVNEHEMGELFKVLAFAPANSATGWLPMGFSAGDRTHRL